MHDKLIVLEFNELVPSLLDRFIAEGKLPNFKRLRDQSIVAITDAEEKAPLLEPWIQWVTVHSGEPYAVHKCFQLNDGVRFKAPRIWDLASEAGKSVWICGSMNAGVQTSAINGMVLPDPWATEIKAIPFDYFEPYVKLVRAYVQEHSSGRPNVSRADILRFIRFMVANGLSAPTLWNTLRQLAGERRLGTQWRRATILDRLQWDLFRTIYRSRQPALSTFFLNSTAHFQHFHWREMEPDLFAVKPKPADTRVFGDAIAFGYQQMDRIVGEALGLAGSDTTVMLCTALSQQPMLTYEERGGRQIFRHRDHESLLTWAGLPDFGEYSPVMSQQFVLTFGSEDQAQAAAEKIAAVRTDKGEQVMLAYVDGTQVRSGCMIDSPPSADALVTSGASDQPRRFWDLFYPLEALRSGMHHPEGVLWVRTPSRRNVSLGRKVSLLEIAPTILALIGVRAEHQFHCDPIPEVVSALANLSQVFEDKQPASCV